MQTTEEMLLAAGFIFILRVANNAVGTIRLVTLARQQRFLTAFLGFFEALIFAITVGGVVQDLSNLLNMFAYCAGFSVGSYVGMALEARFIVSYQSVNVIAKQGGRELAAALRQAGFGVTETTGEGLHGEVLMLRSVVMRRDVPRLVETVSQTLPDAFIAVEEARSVRQGYIRAGRNQPY